MNVLDLFSGIGGFSLGLERTGMRTIAFCEIDPYCRAVLAKHWPDVPVFGDVRELTAKTLADAFGYAVRDKPGRRNGSCRAYSAEPRYNGAQRIDVICGGFPCQDISVAGKGAGIGGERSGLWSEYARIIGEVRPRYVIVENVAALLRRGIERVLGDLAALGFSSVWHCIPASAVGAPHRRDRVWIIAKRNDYASCKAPDDRSCCIAAAVREREEKFAGDRGTTWHDLEACWRGLESRRREDEEWARGTRAQTIQSLQNGSGVGYWSALDQGGGCPSHQSGLEGQQPAEPCRCIEEEAFRFSQTIGTYLSRVIHGGIGDVRPDGGISDDPAPQRNVGLDGDEGIPASAVGAPHRRDRVWIVAHATGAGWRSTRPTVTSKTNGGRTFGEPCRASEVADTPGLRWGENVFLLQSQESGGTKTGCAAGSHQGIGWEWLIEPDVGRVAHGVPARVDRLRALGNAVVPQIAEIIGRAIMTADARRALEAK